MKRSSWRRVVAVAVAAPLLLSGCQSRVGVAAIVGSVQITEAQVQQAAEQGLRSAAVRKAAGSQPVQFRQLVLGRLIQHEVLVDAARKLGVRTTDGDLQRALSSLTSQAGGHQQLEQYYAQNLAVAPGQIEAAVRDLVVFRAIGTKLAGSLTFTDAELKQVFDQRPSDQASLTFEQYKPTAVERARQQAGAAAAGKYLADFVRRLKVSVNPRYGRFNRSSVSVVPVTDKLVRDSATPAPSSGP